MVDKVGPFLPYGRQNISDDDIQAVVDVLKSDHLTTGPAIERFEAALCDATDAPFAVACSSGTAALHLGVLALGLGPGDIGIVPAVTFTATANCLRFAGAEVRFADVEPDTGLVSPETIKACLDQCKADGTRDRVKAIFTVHLAGQTADMNTIADLAAAEDLILIEDACHALGGAWQERSDDWAKVGSCKRSALAAFSFHPVKTIAMGEGGAVTTRDEALADRMRLLRSHGITRDENLFVGFPDGDGGTGRGDPWHYEMLDLGFNYRASDLHCALGASQLARLGEFVESRRRLADLYDDQLAVLAPTVVPIARSAAVQPAWHLYAVLIDFEAVGRTKRELMAHLRTAGIGSQVHYIPVPWQPYYQGCTPARDYPGAKRYYERELSLPLFFGMADNDVKRVVQAVKRWVEG
ncbi:MAG: UDP-4-amino-4,6-dideoxy-N-acetyl-beta-L-altrosamine transaminase [Magnetovibrionaceae bacterium]